jgi:hypothetical protein
MYKPVDSDSEIDEKIKIFDCFYWSLRNKCCMAKYNREVSPKFPLVDFKNDDSMDAHCVGKSNISRCSCYTPRSFSEMDLRRKANEEIRIYERELKRM